MIYLDDSFLTPLFREETTSPKVAAFLVRQTAGTLAASKWESVEFAKLMSRDVRIGALMETQGQRLINEFEAMVANSLIVLMACANDFGLAQRYGANFSTKLRAPDALHLAIANNNKAEFIAALDDRMLFAAKKLKVGRNQQWHSGCMYVSLDGKSRAFELQAALENSQGVKPRHPESNSIVERFNGTVRDETNNDYGNNHLQAEAIIDKLMHHYNEKRLHASLGSMTPATWHRRQPDEVRDERARQIAAARAHRRMINQQRFIEAA